MLIGVSQECYRSPRRIVNPEATQAYALASQMNIQRCQQLKEEQLRLQQTAESSETLAAQLTLQKNLERAAKQSQLAQTHKFQIETFVQQRRVALEGKKVPGIDPEFHGYPSIPETPSDLRKRRKRDQQKRLKYELELQMEEKQEKRTNAKASEKAEMGQMFSTVESVYQTREQQEKIRKAKQSAELWQAWKEAEKLKKEQDLIFTGARIPTEKKTDPVVPLPDRYTDNVLLTVSSPMATSLTPDPVQSDTTDKGKDQRHQVQISDRNRNWRREIAHTLKTKEAKKARKPFKAQFSSQTYSHRSPFQGAGKQVVSKPLLDSASVPTISTLTKRNVR